MPPWIVRVMGSFSGEDAKSRKGNNAWKTRSVQAAPSALILMLRWAILAGGRLGEKVNTCEPAMQPLHSAFVAAARYEIDDTCWGFRPPPSSGVLPFPFRGAGRLPRTLVILIGVPVRADRETATRAS